MAVRLMTIGEKLRSLRENRELSRKELADLIGKSESFITKLELGFLKSAKRDTLESLAKALHVTVDFFTEEKNMLPQDVIDTLPPEVVKGYLQKDFHPWVTVTQRVYDLGITLEEYNTMVDFLLELNKSKNKTKPNQK